jgi:predicted HicB family RNase H-like nuclease
MINTVLRIDKELYKKVKAAATKEDRSINNMLCNIIKRYFSK